MAFGPPEYDQSPIRGMDFSWLAVDVDDHVAWLVTFGSAVVPRWAEQDADAFQDMESLLARLPKRGAVEMTDSSSFAREWKAAAEGGVFAYDWDVFSGPYKLIARPQSPVKLSDLPSALADLARLPELLEVLGVIRRELRRSDTQDVVLLQRPGGVVEVG